MTVRAGDRLVRIAGLCGLAAPVISLGSIYVGIALSPWFNWHTDALSDMGVSPVAGLFNGALLAGGAFNLIFVIGVGRWLGPGRLARLGISVLLVASVALALVGIFSEDYGRLHYYVSATYFLSNPIGYVLVGTAMYRKVLPVHGALTIAAAIAAFLAIAATPHKGIAVPEIVASTITGSWTFSMGVNLLAGSTSSPQPPSPETEKSVSGEAGVRQSKLNDSPSPDDIRSSSGEGAGG